MLNAFWVMLISMGWIYGIVGAMAFIRWVYRIK